MTSVLVEWLITVVDDFPCHRVGDILAIVVGLSLDEPFLLHPLRFFAKELVTGDAFGDGLFVTGSLLFESHRLVELQPVGDRHFNHSRRRAASWAGHTNVWVCWRIQDFTTPSTFLLIDRGSHSSIVAAYAEPSQRRKGQKCTTAVE